MLTVNQSTNSLYSKNYLKEKDYNSPAKLYQLYMNPSFQAAIPKTLPTSAEQKSVANTISDLASKLLENGNSRAGLNEIFAQLKKITGELGEKLGFKAEDKVPRMLQTDAYYVTSDFYIHPDAKDRSVYQIAFRREELPWQKDMGVKPEDRKFIFYGLQDVIEDILHDPITKEEVDKADEFFKTAKNGGQFKWNREIWDRIVNENNGIIPIKIQALPDGSTVFPGEPIIQIKAEDGYGELAAWFETKLLQVWAPSERASMLRHWLEYNKNMIRETSDATLTEAEITAKAQKMLVDFSDRSSMNSVESAQLGKASMTVFPVQSTMSALYRAAQDNAGKVPGLPAMPSTPHRVIESFKDEKDAYETLYNFIKGGPGSFVTDTYNTRRATKEYILPLAKRAQKENQELGTNTIINARPDSGDPFEEIKYVLDLAVENGLYREVKTRDGRTLKGMTVLKALEADGMNFKKMMELNNRLIEAGYSPADCISYGVGGSLHDKISRSNMSAAQKLAEVGSGDNRRQVMKMAEGKESIPGEIKLVREEGSKAPTVRRLDEEGKDAYITWFDGIDGHGIEYTETFENIQKRVLNDFDKYERPDNIFSEGVKSLKEEIKSHHRTNN